MLSGHGHLAYCLLYYELLSPLEQNYFRGSARGGMQHREASEQESGPSGQILIFK